MVTEYDVLTFSPILLRKILDMHGLYICVCVCVCVYLNSLRPLREVMNPTSRLSQKQQNKTKSVCVDELQSKRIRKKLL